MSAAVAASSVPSSLLATSTPSSTSAHTSLVLTLLSQQQQPAPLMSAGHKRSGSELSAADDSSQPPTKKLNNSEGVTGQAAAASPVSSSAPASADSATLSAAEESSAGSSGPGNGNGDGSESHAITSPVVTGTGEDEARGRKGARGGKGKKEKDSSYNRKEKSLGLLCENFLRAFEGGERPSVSLDLVAKELKVERRRIYDIVNILEAVAVVSRSGKNMYRWHGTSLLAERIGALNAAMLDSEVETAGALKRGMLAMNRAMMRPDNAAAAGDEANDTEADKASTDEVMVDLVLRNVAVMEGKYASNNNNNNNNNSSSSSSTSTTEATSTTAGGTASSAATSARGGDVGTPATSSSIAKKKKSSSGRDVRREQSLGHLSAVFVQMFLANDTRVVSLEEAARWLLRSNLQQTTDGTQQQQQQSDNDCNDEHIRPSKDDTAAADSAPTASSTSPTAPLAPSEAGAGKAKDKAASLFKSKVRRLYDIANVLSSLKLIEKIQLIQSRRPAFRWLGASVYPLQSIINSDAYTTEASNKGKTDSAAKRRTPSKQDHSVGALRVRQEGGSLDNGSGDANGTQPQTLHSAFSTPGSLAAVRTQPLSFSFTKVPPSIITPTGPSLSQLHGSAIVPAASFSASSSSSASAPSVLPTSTASSSSSPSLSSKGGGVYWIVNHDRSFSMDANKMAEFEPLDFAYLPYICPPGLHSLLSQPQPHQQSTEGTEPPPREREPLPPHVAELPPSVRAAYVRDTAGFVSLFSQSCRRWMQLIPEMANQQRADKLTNGSNKAAQSTADTATSATTSHSSSDSASASASSVAASSSSTRPRRSSIRSGSSTKVR